MVRTFQCLAPTINPTSTRTITLGCKTKVPGFRGSAIVLSECFNDKDSTMGLALDTIWKRNESENLLTEFTADDGHRLFSGKHLHYLFLAANKLNSIIRKERSFTTIFIALKIKNSMSKLKLLLIYDSLFLICTAGTEKIICVTIEMCLHRCV